MVEQNGWFERVFGFIVQLLDSWYPVAFFEVLDSITDKHGFAIHTDKGCIFPDSLIPCSAQLFQRPGVGAEKVIQGSAGTKEKSADKGGITPRESARTSMALIITTNQRKAALREKQGRNLMRI